MVLLRLTKISLLSLLVAVLPAGAAPRSQPAPDAPKAKVAVFPLAGDASGDLREKVGFALRRKLEREGAFEVIDGPTMSDLAGATPPGVDVSPAALQRLVADAGANILIWGELSGGSDSLAGATIRLKMLDLRRSGAEPQDVTKKIDDPTDLRFVTEQILQRLPGVGAFAHPNEQAVKDDATSVKLWQTNPNLVTNGDFSQPGHWDALYMSEKYAVEVKPQLPGVDKVCIVPIRDGPDNDLPAGPHAPAPVNNVLAMNLSKLAAENNGLACLSAPIAIQPNRRYRISFRYKSDGPSTHVFVKGYTAGKDVAGKPSQREVFRTQVPPGGATNGKWETVTCDVNPYHPAFAVQTLRVDLYAYLSPGIILFDDVVLKEIGPLTEKPKDDAIKPP